MNLQDKYQPGLRYNSFYEIQDPEDCISETDKTEVLGRGSTILQAKSADPYEGTWIGIGELKMGISKKST